ANFNHGALVKLTGTPAGGSKAVVWNGCDAVNGSNECEVTLGGDRTVEASFNLEQHLLTVTKNGTGSGTVTSNPAGINRGATECQADLNHNAVVDIPGGPAAGCNTVVWQSCCGAVNGSNQCEVTIGAEKSAEASFDLEQHLLTVAENGTGSGTVTSNPAG